MDICTGVVCVVVCCHPFFMISPTSDALILFGIFPRDKLNFENIGGFVDGKTQSPIFNGGVVETNNSPEIVKPKFS